MSIEDDDGNRPQSLSRPAQDDQAGVYLCEVLDRVLNKGVVLAGDLTISVADVDLIYLGLELVLTSIESARRAYSGAPVELARGWPITRERGNEPV